jgi:hypothetical protein
MDPLMTSSLASSLLWLFRKDELRIAVHPSRDRLAGHAGLLNGFGDAGAAREDLDRK